MYAVLTALVKWHLADTGIEKATIHAGQNGCPYAVPWPKGPAARREPAMGMTPAPRKCAACGTPALPPFRAPAPELAPDLDMRPGEPTRSTLAKWIATCPSCGACAPDLAALPPGAAATVNSDAYRAAANPFLRWATICEAAGATAEAAEAVLQAAWAADDAGDALAAAALRRRTAALWGAPADTETRLRLIDVLRRAADFAEAQRRIEALDGLDENSERIAAYQAARIAARDAGRHLISSALRAPASRPHVAHGRPPARGGFWGRLIGRS